MEKPALIGGEPVKKTPFPAWPQYGNRERTALSEVLESRTWWRTPGTQTARFERDFAAYQDASYAIATTNGTAALEVALAALGVGCGDEVIVPDFTFVATATAVLFAGALPVLVDVTADTYCLDPELAEAAITERTRAIVPVHLGGHPADMDSFKDLARRYDLHLVEDSAHAHGTEWKGRKVGAIGDIGTFSFQQSKLMTAGEGGAIVTDDAELEQRARSIHDCGRMPGEWFYAHFVYGSNYRLSEWQGAVLRQQLSRMDEQATIRIRNADYLDRALSDIEGITPQSLDPRCTHRGYYAYIFHYDQAAFDGLSTDRFIKALEAEGVPTQASYPPIHEMALFQQGEYRKRLPPAQQSSEHAFLEGSFPNTVRGARDTVWLVHRVLLGTKKDMRQVVKAITKIQRCAKTLI